VIFSDIKLNNREPVYLQLMQCVKRAILTGAVANGDVLPSRREVAALLGINPNTAQKAFKLMEDAGYVVTPRNSASVVRVTPEIRAQIQEEFGHEFVRAFVTQAQENHLSYRRVIELISQYWEEDV